MKHTALRPIGKKRASQALIRKELYELLREIVRFRDGEKCLRCSKRDHLQLSHIYPKGKHRSMEFEPLNVKLLCVGCHLFWWHKSPVEAREWIETRFGLPWLTKLKLMSQSSYKSDLKLQLIYLEKVREDLMDRDQVF